MDKTININKSDRGFRLNTTHDFFKNEYLIVEITEDKIIFKIPTIDYNGKQLKTYNQGSTVNAISLYSDFIKEGKYFPDEESTEDELIIYF